MLFAPSSVFQCIVLCLLNKKLLYESSETNEERSIHPFFRVIATQNPAGSSYKRSTLSSSIRDCFRIVTNNTKIRVFPSIEKLELSTIITGISNGNTTLGDKITRAHEEASNRKHITKKAIDQGKDYTLRDCSRAKSIMEICEHNGMKRDKAVNHAIAIAYNKPFEIHILQSGSGTVGVPKYRKHNGLH